MSELMENVTNETQIVGEVPVKKEKKFRFGWFILALSLPIISLCLQYIGMIPTIIRASIRVATEQVTDMNQVMQISTEVIMENMGEILLIYHVLNIVVFFLWYYYGCVKRANVKLREVSTLKNRAVLILCTILVQFVITSVLQLLVYVIPETMEAYNKLLETAGLGDDILSILAATLIAPIGEELIFRGVAWNSLQRCFAGVNSKRKVFWLVNTIQALLFGIFHMNIIQGCYAFLIGLLCGYYREKYNTVKASIYFHMVFNCSAFIIISPIFMVLPETKWTYILTFILGAVFFTIYFIKYELVKKSDVN